MAAQLVEHETLDLKVVNLSHVGCRDYLNLKSLKLKKIICGVHLVPLVEGFE